MMVQDHNGSFERWVSTIPWAVWALIIANLIWAAVQWQALNSRDATAQVAIEVLNRRMDQIDNIGTRNLVRLEERQKTNTEAIQYLQRQHDWLVQMLTPHVAAPPATPGSRDDRFRLQSAEPIPK